MRCCGFLLLLGLVVGAAAQPERAPTTTAPQTEPSRPAKKTPAVPQTDAERVSRLTRTIEDNEKQAADLKAKLDDPESEYAQAEAEFKQLDAEYEAQEREPQKLKDSEQADEVTKRQEELDALNDRRQLAKERFDLAIQERRTDQEQLATLEQKLVQDREALQKLLQSPAAATQPVAAAVQAAVDSNTPVVVVQAPAQPSAATPAPAAPAVAPVPGMPAAGPAGASAEPAAPKTEAAPPSKELVAAQQAAQNKAVEAAKAQEEVRSVADRIDALNKSIDLERKQLETARKKAENARDTEQTLSDQAQKRFNEGAAQEEVRKIWAESAEARQRYRQAQADVEERIDRLDGLENELRQLQGERIATLQEAKAKEQEAEQARKEVERLESPYSPRNLLRWVMLHGPRILGIVVGMFLVLWLARRGENQIVKLLVGRSDRGSIEDRENRATTLVGVFHSAATLAVFVGGGLMIFTELGVNIVPLMGGAAVVGLAVAFGAQNLIRDYFYGFMILLENQYTVNDVVKVGDVSGQVEKITLRVTVLRGLDGTVHFVPNGEITRVSNMTHGWSRALFDIPVAYKEDVDRVMEELVELAKELRRDQDYRSLILEMPEMLGVDEFGDSAVVIKFFIKTRPLKQWTVKRELLRRIKKRFDEIGIEIPFPHRTVFHRYENGGPEEFAHDGVATERR